MRGETGRIEEVRGSGGSEEEKEKEKEKIRLRRILERKSGRQKVG